MFDALFEDLLGHLRRVPEQRPVGGGAAPHGAGRGAYNRNNDNNNNNDNIIIIIIIIY